MSTATPDPPELKRMNIIVVGGSLAGLLSGLALKRLGHNVHILERNPLPLFQGNGAGILAGIETRDYLEKFDKSKRNFLIPSAFRHYLDIHGHERHREEWIQYATSWDLLYHILRANFDGVKTSYCQVQDQAGGTTIYDYDANVIDLKVDDDGVTLFYEQNNQKKSVRGDVLLAADGASSRIRSLVHPNIDRHYAGYVVWRGTVPESDASESLVTTFADCITFFHAPGMQVASYLIPGKDGVLERGNRLINWVWYYNCPDPSEILTDCDGRRHRWTVPRGKIQPRIWAKLTDLASRDFPPQFAELIRLTRSPFVQAISDVLSPQAIHYDGRVVLVGDALAGFRPHTAGATSQAAFHGLQLSTQMKTWNEWMTNKNAYEDLVMKFAKHGVRHGQQLGYRSQFGQHKLDGKMNMGYLSSSPENVLHSQENQLEYDNRN